MELRAAGRAGGGLVLSDGHCPGPGSRGSRGPAQAGQAASPKPLGGRESVCVVGSGGEYVGRVEKMNRVHFLRTCNPPNTWLYFISHMASCGPERSRNSPELTQTLRTASGRTIRLQDSTFSARGRGRAARCPPSGCAWPAEAQATHLSPCPEPHTQEHTHT